MTQTAMQIGNSVGMVIPQPLRKQIGIKAGTKLDVQLDASGHAFIVHLVGPRTNISSITPEFKDWLDKFNKRYFKALKELATK